MVKSQTVKSGVAVSFCRPHSEVWSFFLGQIPEFLLRSPNMSGCVCVSKLGALKTWMVNTVNMDIWYRKSVVSRVILTLENILEWMFDWTRIVQFWLMIFYHTFSYYIGTYHLKKKKTWSSISSYYHVSTTLPRSSFIVHSLLGFTIYIIIYICIHLQ